MILLLLAAAQPAGSTAGTGCTPLLTGNWAGRGTFGPATQIEGKATYRADHTFTSSSRFATRGQPPQEAAVAGRWSARAGRRPGTCTIDMSSQTANSSSSSSSDVQFVNRDTYRAMGVDMHRVPGR